MPRAAPGSVVAWWNEGALAFAVVAGEDKQRIRLVLPGGREERVPASRIAFDLEAGGGVPGATLEARVEAGRRADVLAALAAERAKEVEVAVLWQIVREEGPEHALAGLALLALGEDTGSARAAVALALLADGIHFVRRGELWEPRDAEAVAQILHQTRQVARRETERQEAIEALRGASRGTWRSTGNDAERGYLEALEAVAVHDLGAPESARALALEALNLAGISGDRVGERAFRLLRRIGRFGSDDENLIVLRHRLKTLFPEEVCVAAARAAERGFARGRRSDLGALEVITIDSQATREIDDALSVERVAGGTRIGIHIADPCAFVELGDAVDAEALARTSSHYLPDLRIPMLPAAISEESASLLAGSERPTLSFLVDLDGEGRIRGFDVERSLVRPRIRFDYEGADRALEEGAAPGASLLRDLHAALLAHEARRVEAGALVLEAGEIDLHVDSSGRVELERIDSRSPSRKLVAEAMVLAGAVAARFCSERGIPILFRKQQAPSPLPEPVAGGITDPVQVRALRRVLRRGEVCLEAQPHFALGLEAYAQVTSPLRRYQDLASHRQILAVLEGRPPEHSIEDLRRIAALTEAAEADARQAERSAETYWKLRYLEQSGARLVEGIVVDVRPVVVLLLETLLEERVPALAGVPLGERLMLRIERVNPRAELLLLRPT